MTDSHIKRGEGYSITSQPGQVTLNSLDVSWLSFDTPELLDAFVGDVLAARDRAFASAHPTPVQDIPKPKFTLCCVVARSYTHFKDWVARNGESPFVLESFGQALHQRNTRCVLNEHQLRGLDRDRTLILILSGSEDSPIRRFALSDYFKHIVFTDKSTY